MVKIKVEYGVPLSLPAETLFRQSLVPVLRAHNDTARILNPQKTVFHVLLRWEENLNVVQHIGSFKVCEAGVQILQVVSLQVSDARRLVNQAPLFGVFWQAARNQRNGIARFL